MKSKHRNSDGKRYYDIKGDPMALDQRRELRLSYDSRLWNKAVKAYSALVKKDSERGHTAITFGYPFKVLTLQEYLQIVILPCYYCDNVPSLGADRMDNDMGHWSSNVVPCCEKCNVILGTLPFNVKENLKDGLKRSVKDGLLDAWTPIYKTKKKSWL